MDFAKASAAAGALLVLAGCVYNLTYFDRVGPDFFALLGPSDYVISALTWLPLLVATQATFGILFLLSHKPRGPVTIAYEQTASFRNRKFAWMLFGAISLFLAKEFLPHDLYNLLLVPFLNCTPFRPDTGFSRRA